MDILEELNHLRESGAGAHVESAEAKPAVEGEGVPGKADNEQGNEAGSGAKDVEASEAHTTP